MISTHRVYLTHVSAEVISLIDVLNLNLWACTASEIGILPAPVLLCPGVVEELRAAMWSLCVDRRLVLNTLTGEQCKLMTWHWNTRQPASSDVPPAAGGRRRVCLLLINYSLIRR